MAVNLEVVLWFQFAYAIWQFVRVAKFCRLPYAVLAHSFMWLIGRWGRPFTVRNYIVLDPPREKYYISSISAIFRNLIEKWKTKKPGRECTIDLFVPTNGDEESQVERKLQRLNVKDKALGLDYHLCSRTLPYSFVWNYLRDDPDCFARCADLIIPGFDILDRVSHAEGLKMICHGDYIPVHVRRRFLAVPDRERELNQNFMRFLATIPLVAQAKGYNDQSVWISLVIIFIDQLSLLFNWLWERFKDCVVFAFHMFMIKCPFRSSTRRTVCTFFSTISDRMMFSDEVRMNFIRIRKGDVVCTMSPFDGADFEIVQAPPFERKREQPVPYTEAQFGRYEEQDGELFPKGFPSERTPIYSHNVQGSRIDTMFLEGGGFYNFINNQHLHFGVWEDQNDKENFLDLLQVMQEKEMLPILQTDDELFKSLKFNVYLTPGKSLQDITFLKLKKDIMIGGKV